MKRAAYKKVKVEKIAATADTQDDAKMAAEKAIRERATANTDVVRAAAATRTQNEVVVWAPAATGSQNEVGGRATEEAIGERAAGNADVVRVSAATGAGTGWDRSGPVRT